MLSGAQTIVNIHELSAPCHWHEHSFFFFFLCLPEIIIGKCWHGKWGDELLLCCMSNLWLKWSLLWSEKHHNDFLILVFWRNSNISCFLTGQHICVCFNFSSSVAGDRFLLSFRSPLVPLKRQWVFFLKKKVKDLLNILTESCNLSYMTKFDFFDWYLSQMPTIPAYIIVKSIPQEHQFYGINWQRCSAHSETEEAK